LINPSEELCQINFNSSFSSKRHFENLLYV
jgi:hypothetical protein